METECVDLGSSKEIFSSNDWPKAAWLAGAWPKLDSLKIGEVSVVKNGDCDDCGQANKVELLANSKQLNSKIAIVRAIIAPLTAVFRRAFPKRQRKRQRFLMRSNFAAARFKFG